MSADVIDAAEVRPLKLIRGDGVRGISGVDVDSIYSNVICEDGETVLVLAKLVDGRMVGVTICPGSPVTVHAIETETIE